jgi:hypothetical protein
MTVRSRQRLPPSERDGRGYAALVLRRDVGADAIVVGVHPSRHASLLRCVPGDTHRRQAVRWRVGNS